MGRVSRRPLTKQRALGPVPTLVSFPSADPDDGLLLPFSIRSRIDRRSQAVIAERRKSAGLLVFVIVVIVFFVKVASVDLPPNLASWERVLRLRT